MIDQRTFVISDGPPVDRPLPGAGLWDDAAEWNKYCDLCDLSQFLEDRLAVVREQIAQLEDDDSIDFDFPGSRR